MTLISLLPKDLRTLLAEIEELGFTLCLVGGGVRDYLLTKQLSHDLDFEIRPKNEMSELEWEITYRKLHVFFSNRKLKYDELPYLITRVKFLDFDLEFSSPRTERDVKEKKGHHHFEATLSGKLSHKEAFKRRDFTINAIGMEFDFTKQKETLLDPYQGIEDLEKKVLRNIDDYFFSDSVRFLRLIRFSLRFHEFKIDNSLKSRLSLFELSHLSLHHFKAEMRKSKNYGQFINLFFDWVYIYQLEIPAVLRKLEDALFPEGISNDEELLVSAFLTSEELANHVAEILLLPKKELSDLTSFKKSFDLMKEVKKVDFKKMEKLSLEKVAKLPFLREIKNLEEKKKWKEALGIKDSDLSFSWKNWSDVFVNQKELDSTKPELRSYLRFYKAIKKI